MHGFGHEITQLSTHQCQIALLHHLMAGAACICVSKGFETQKELSLKAFEIVLTSDAGVFLTEQLVLIAMSLEAPAQFQQKHT